MARNIIKIEFMKCDVCRISTLHEIKIEENTNIVTNVTCFKCKYNNDEELYNILESCHESGIRYRLGI